jgi:hypothetical protein
MMDRKPVEPPDTVSVALREAVIVILGHEERIATVLAVGAVSVVKDLSALPASYGIMAHDFSPSIKSGNQINPVGQGLRFQV